MVVTEDGTHLSGGEVQDGATIAVEYVRALSPIYEKRGKLPAETVSQEYTLEYGTDTLEIHTDAIEKGARALLVDDLLATGGTALAAASLVEKLGGVIAEACFIVDLPDLGGAEKLEAKNYRVFALTEFEGK